MVDGKYTPDFDETIVVIIEDVVIGGFEVVTVLVMGIIGIFILLDLIEHQAFDRVDCSHSFLYSSYNIIII